jgi:hypothetical protein
LHGIDEKKLEIIEHTRSLTEMRYGMKKAIFFCFSFFLVTSALSAAYYYSYQRAANRAREYSSIIEAEQVAKADTVKLQQVLPQTECIVESYDKVTGQMVLGELAEGEELLGKTRQEVLSYLSDYMEELPVSEQQKGLLSYELLSFSEDKVVLRKTYDTTSLGFQYYVAVFDNEVVVYYSDKKTVFDYTGISTENLPELELRKLNYGIYVKNQEELYGILENYSS